jgi:hypothetical protein
LPGRAGAVSNGDACDKLARFTAGTGMTHGRRGHGRIMSRSASRLLPEDPEWAIARSIQIQERADGGEPGPRITARRHPTGWFISAVHPAGMTAGERADFGHFVCVRVYLLLHNGPIPGAWERGSSRGEWVADLVAVPELAELNATGRFRPRT